MFSVVIPTMWKYEPFIGFLEDLTKFDLIDDIIIVNNDYINTPKDGSAIKPDWHPVLLHPKIRMSIQSENIFVNPAWNYGVKHAKNDMVCIMNDDLIFDIRVFYHVQERLSEQYPTIGMIVGDPIHNQPPVTDGAIKIIPYPNGLKTFGFGQLMFVHKPSWVPIPEDLKLYYGDDWILNVTHMSGKQILIITDLLHKTPFAVTSSTVAGTKLYDEHIIFRRRLEEYTRGKKGATMDANFLKVEYERACLTPSDINEHLPVLLDLANQCETVMEFGVRTGVSTRAFLVSRAALWSIDIDPLPEAIQLFLNAQSIGRVCNITKGDTLQVTILPQDMLFIDTHHVYEQLAAELERHHGMIDKFIAIHDTESYPDLLRAVAHFLHMHGDEWTTHHHYANNNGLTVLRRIKSVRDKAIGSIKPLDTAPETD